MKLEGLYLIADTAQLIEKYGQIHRFVDRDGCVDDSIPR